MQTTCQHHATLTVRRGRQSCGWHVHSHRTHQT